MPALTPAQPQARVVQVVHISDGLCLTQDCAAGQNCSRITQHQQFRLSKCDAADAKQRFRAEESGSSSTDVTLTSTVDPAFRVNVGEVAGPQRELQLWRPCTAGDAQYEQGIGHANEIFRLNSDGALRVKFGTPPAGGPPSFVDCVDVCHAGDAACKSDDAVAAAPAPARARGGLQKGIQFLGKGMEGAFAYDDPRALQSLKNLAATGADHIALTFSWYLNLTESKHFATGPIRPIHGPAPSGLNFANCRWAPPFPGPSYLGHCPGLLETGTCGSTHRDCLLGQHADRS